MGVQGRASSRPGQIGCPIQQHHHPGSFDISLTSSGDSAADEQQTYESDEIRQHQVHPPGQQRQQLHQHHRDCLHTLQYLHSNEDASNSVRSIPGDRIDSFIERTDHVKQATPEMRTKLSGQQQQQHQKHRQLRAHVHQQLQRIYGDRSQQFDAKQHHDQLMPISRHKQMMQQPQHHLASQDDNFAPHEWAGNNGIRPFEDANQQSSTEQTYDSLSSPATAAATSSTTRQHHFKDCRRRADPIGAIPEEASVASEEVLQSSSLQMANEIDDTPEQAQANREAREQTELVARSQLESLHYATATAAALLSATANAAAAIAATTDHQQQLKQRNQVIWPSQQQAPRIKSNREQESKMYQQFAHQKMMKERACNCCRHEQERHKTRQVRCAHHQPQQVELMRQKELYAEATAATGARPTYGAHQRVQPDPRAQFPYSHHLSHRIYSERDHQHPGLHHQSLAVERAKQILHHRALRNRPIPPQPPARGPPMMMMMGPSRQPQAQPPPMMPAALAIVHTGASSKAASAKADLIGRMLINNIVAAQRIASESNYNLKRQPQPQAAAQNPYQMATREILYTKRPPPEAQVFSSGLPAGRAPSDSSGHSSAPLVVNRDLVPMSFMERLCRIDLTLFWWSLLLISLLFVGVVVAVSRYVL